MEQLRCYYSLLFIIALMLISANASKANDHKNCTYIDSAANSFEKLCIEGKFDSIIVWGDSLDLEQNKSCKSWLRIYIQLGKAHSQNGQFDQAIHDYKTALTHSQGDDTTLIAIYMYMSAVHRRAGVYDMALSYIRKAIRISNIQNIETHEPDLFNSYANIISRNNVDSAIFYYKKALVAYGSNCESCRSTVLNNIGSMHAIRGDFDKSVIYFRQALSIDRMAKDSLRMMRTLFNIGRFEFTTGDLKNAEHHLNQSIALAEKYGWNESIPFMSTLIGGIEAVNKDYKNAYTYLLKAASMQDSLLRANSAEAISNAISSFELKQAELENNLLAKENELFKKDQNIQQISLSLALIIVFLLMLVVVVIWNQRKKLHIFNQSLDLQNEKLKQNIVEKDQLMGILTHDLSTPMNGMVSIVDLLLEPNLDQNEKENFLIDIKSSAQAGIELINDLINLYQEESSDKDVTISSIELPELLKEIYSPFYSICQVKNQDLQVNITGVSNVNSNPNALKSAISNLLSNATKFSPNGGKIKIAAFSKGEKVYITISDSGPGFSERDKAKLFGKFNRLSAQPTGNENSSGLGLYTVKLMLDKIGGAVELTETSAEGSTFTITI